MLVFTCGLMVGIVLGWVVLGIIVFFLAPGPR